MIEPAKGGEGRALILIVESLSARLLTMFERLKDAKETVTDLALGLVQLGCAVWLLARLVKRK